MKLRYARIVLKGEEVAPRAGAWIEMKRLTKLFPLICGSHPARVRGLKLKRYVYPYPDKVSHPARVRGLK